MRQKFDLLGDWDGPLKPLPTGPGPAAAKVGVDTSIPTSIPFSEQRERVVPDIGVDALVLVQQVVTCKGCKLAHINTDHKLFLRAGGHFKVNMLDPIFTRSLPREVKQIALECEACAQCFGPGRR